MVVTEKTKGAYGFFCFFFIYTLAMYSLFFFSYTGIVNILVWFTDGDRSQTEVPL